MPQQHLSLEAFNSGVFGAWMQGRSRFGRYAFALKKGLNSLSLPQGPSISAPGTQFIVPAFDQTRRSWMMPFRFSGDNNLMLEFAHNQIRFFDNSGLVLFAATDAVGASVGTNTIVFDVPGHALVVNDYVALQGSGFTPASNLVGVVAKVSVVVSDLVTVDVTSPGGFVFATVMSLAKVLMVSTPYEADDLDALRAVQSLDSVYLFCRKKSGGVIGHPVQRLDRKGTTKWTLTEVEFKDGPYLDEDLLAPVLSFDVTGGAVPKMTSNTTPAGYVASATGAGTDAFKAFDQDSTTHWQSTTDQKGFLKIKLLDALAVTGYAIHASAESTDLNFKAVDYAPSTFTLEGSNDDSTYVVLDRQVEFVAYQNRRTPYFEITNKVEYLYYRLQVDAVVRNGSLKPRVARLALGVESTDITITAASATAINGDLGFLATDVGRLLRLQGADLAWRSLRITARTSSTIVVATLEGEPFSQLEPAFRWRFGLFSNTTGHPLDGIFWKDRLIMGGVRDFPSIIVGSETQNYEGLKPTDSDGLVLDSNGFTLEINSRDLAAIRWFQDLGRERGLVVGTVSGIHNVRRLDKTAGFAASNADQDPINDEEVAFEAPLRVASAVLFLSISKRKLHELAYVFNDDGFKAPDLTQLASNISAKSSFEQIVRVRSPYPIVFCRRADGTLAMMVYSRAEEVVGWSEYDGGGAYESIGVLPDANQDQQLLWGCVKRTVNGATVRYIERMAPMWEEGFTVESTEFVQASVRYDGAPTTEFFGLAHWEGEQIAGLADGAPITPQTVVDGKITLPETKSKVVLGKGFEAETETVSLEGGAFSGNSAQGQQKRIHDLVIHFLDTGVCEIGSRTEGVLDLDDVNFREETDPLGQPPPLKTGFVAISFPAGNDREATIVWRRPADKPLPLNVIALLPAIQTQA